MPVRGVVVDSNRSLQLEKITQTAAFDPVSPDYESLFMNLSVGVYRSTPSGRQVRTNPALVRMHGYTDEYELLSAMTDVAKEWYVDPKRRMDFLELIERDGFVVDFVSEVYRHKTSERMWARENAYAKRDAAGRTLFYEGTVEDITAQMQAAHALEEERSLVNAVLDTSAALICIVDADGRLVRFNAACEELSGYSYQEIKDRDILRLLIPEDEAECVRDVVQRVIKNGQRITHVNHWIRRDGSQRLLEWSNALLKTAGAPSYLIGIGIDVTEREEAQAALRASEARLKDFAEAASDWFWEQDADLNVVYLSERFQEATGFTPEEVIGRKRSEIMQEISVEARARHARDLTARRPFRDLEYTYVGYNGRCRRWRVSGRPIFDAKGKFIGYRGTGSDVTEQRRVAELAERAQLRLAEAAETMTDAAAIFDANDRLIFFNANYARLFKETGTLLRKGATFEQLMRGAIKRDLIPESVGREKAWLAERLDHHRNPRGPILQKRSDGRWYRINERRMADGGTVSVVTDVTEMIERETVLREAKEAAESASRAKSHFVASMSHELRTPLNAVIGFAEILQGELFGPLGDKRYGEYAKDIRSSAQHLLGIINDILDLSKIEAGGMSLSESEIDTKELVQSCLQILRTTPPAENVRLELDIGDGLPPIWADERIMRQILINLISNGMKFTPRGGRVRVTSRLTKKGILEITIADNGIGMTETEVERALQPFVQIDSELSRKFDGTGLGLPLARSFTELQGGTLSLKSAPGKGTTVTLRFPKERLRG